MKNILLIIAHDLGQHIGPYGVNTVQTPNLDRMARQGTLFRKNFCPSSSCSPSRASIMTGRWPHSNGVMGLTHDDFLWRLRDGEKHLAQHLGENGYDTCLPGNWHENDRIENVGYTTTVQRTNEGLALSEDLSQNETHSDALDLAERTGFCLDQAGDGGCVPSDIQQGAIYRTSIEQYMPLRPRSELYDLEADSWEQHNLAESHPARKELHHRLISWMKETDDLLLNGPVQSTYNREILRQL